MRFLVTVLITASLSLPVQSQAIGEGASAARDSDFVRARVTDVLPAKRHASHATAAARLDRSVISVWDGIWKPLEEYRHTYANGKLVEVREQGWRISPGDWVPVWREVRTYAGDDLEELRNEIWDAISGSYLPYDRTIYTYVSGSGGASLLETEVFETWVNTQWTLQERVLYSNNGIVETVNEWQLWNGSSWDLLEKETLTEENGDVIQTLEEWSGTAWEAVDRTIFHSQTLASLAVLVADLEAIGDELELVTFFLLKFPPHTSQSWDGAAWMDENRYRHERDGEDRVAVFYWEAFDGLAWFGDSRVVITFGPEDRPERTDFELEDSGIWTPLHREIYSYDGAGNLVTLVLSSDFDGDGTMANQARYEFEWSGSGTSTVSSVLPVTASLDAAYPNPFNPSTTVAYRLAQAGSATIRVFDGLGKEVAILLDGHEAAGEHTVRFDPGDRPTGVYYVVLETGGVRSTMPVVLVR